MNRAGHAVDRALSCGYAGEWSGGSADQVIGMPAGSMAVAEEGL